MEVMPFVILLEEHKRNSQVQNEIHVLIEEMQCKINLLLPPHEDQP
jgi:hypothetical protein